MKSLIYAYISSVPGSFDLPEGRRWHGLLQHSLGHTRRLMGQNLTGLVKFAGQQYENIVERHRSDQAARMVHHRHSTLSQSVFVSVSNIACSSYKDSQQPS